MERIKKEYPRLPVCIQGDVLYETEPFMKLCREYHWELGRRKYVSLREKEREFLKDLKDGIASCGGELTVLDLVEKYLLQKTGVRHSTRAGYKTAVNLLKTDDFGAKRIDKVKLSDAKRWLIQL